MGDNSNGPRVDFVVGTGGGAIRAIAGDRANTEVADPIQKAPDLSGTRARAWLCDIQRGLREMNIRPENNGTLAHWVVEAPWAHPAWHSYSIILLHLRPMPDGRETLIFKDGATHQIFVFALDPKKRRAPMIETGIVAGNFLTPTNYAGQFIEVTDELALERVKKAVVQICAGTLSPDTDYVTQWQRLFGDEMFRYRAGGRIEPKIRR